MTDDDTLRKKLPPLRIAAQVVSTLFCTAVLSFLGTAGTMTGLALGAVLSSTFPTVLEHTAGQSSKAARARYKRYRARGMSPANAAAAVRASTPARQRLSPKVYMAAGLGSFLVFGIAVLLLTGIEGAAGKPIANIVQNKPGHGTSLTGGTTEPSDAPSSNPTPTPSATHTVRIATVPATTISPSSTATPSVTPATVTPSTGPTTVVPSSSPPASPAVVPSSASVPSNQAPATNGNAGTGT